MSKKLENRVAVITGATSGMALATAKLFVEEGAYVFVTGRSQEKLDKAAKEIGNVTAQEIVEGLVKYFGAKFARIWFVDRERRNLILKFSAGKYKNIDGEFSKMSVDDSLKLGLCVCNCVKTKKPAITNDVINDPRIRYPEWAKKEKLKSYAGYPLIYKGEAIAVLGMFSEKKLSPADFEILGVFSDELAKELSSLFDAAEFLAIK